MKAQKWKYLEANACQNLGLPLQKNLICRKNSDVTKEEIAMKVQKIRKIKKEYRQTLSEITQLQDKLDQLEQKAQRYAHQLFSEV